MVALLASTALLLASPGGAAPLTADLKGPWNVTMRASYSTCDEAVAGDVRVEQWSFDSSGGSIKMAVSGSTPASNEAYLGEARE